MKHQMTEQLDLLLTQIARERLSLDDWPESRPIYRELSARTGYTQGTLRQYVSRRMRALRRERSRDVSRALAGWNRKVA